jgi:hypothetical protein
MLMPLIEVPEFGRPEHGWDHETASKTKTIDKHLALFAKRVYKKWDDSPCFVDLSLISSAQRMKNGVHPISFIFKELRGLLGCQSIPVTGLLRDDEYQREIKAALAKDKNGVCLRIMIEQAAKSTFKKDLDSLLYNGQIEIEMETGQIIDQEAVKTYARTTYKKLLWEPEQKQIIQQTTQSTINAKSPLHKDSSGNYIFNETDMET